GLVIAMVLSLLFIILMRFLGGIMVWIIIVAVIVVIGYGCLFAFYGGETVYHKYLIGLQFYNVFLFFWCANFVTALGQMTLAGAFASYYWAFNKPDDVPTLPVFASLGRSLRSTLLLNWLVFVVLTLPVCFMNDIHGSCFPHQTLVIGSYLIAHGFFSVYAMCVDTLFLCFCEDLERNDGSAERPYYMSSTLHEILWKVKAEDPSVSPAQRLQVEDSPMKKTQEKDNA
ncbi:hypothetical protein XENOCAPTIV_008954, partial [Xenoophorus captivus]